MKSKIQILIIEDHEDQWQLVRRILAEQYPEVEPVWKTNPTDTVDYLEVCRRTGQTSPQLILMDLFLPTRLEGYQLLDMIKTHPIYRLIPVIVFSVSRSADDIRQAYMRRTNSYVIKPDIYEDWLQHFHLFQQYWSHTVTLPRLT